MLAPIFLSRLGEEGIRISLGSILLSSAEFGSFGSLNLCCLSFLGYLVAFLQALFQPSTVSVSPDRGGTRGSVAMAFPASVFLVPSELRF